MLVEFTVWGSREWFEEVGPFLERSGFTARPELRWSDPAADGERFGAFFDYDGDALDLEEFSGIMTEVKGMLANAEAPLESISIAPNTGRRR